ncbi:toxic anion resistance protein [Paenibacillus sp. N1-5-1-14]|uniref:toxic anion resistance protein n=1 Tax=Paenibacillus radicibacter TaxID=2972488 RepID=UPI002159A160|nr:toxic anion resistance protein [Paenibacillus radicibacter]MCR8643287.1 toxic anion resistance protein [Paenibacillus radicibacter]
MSFSMNVASDEEIKAVAVEQVQPIPEELVKLKEQADQNVQSIMDLNMDSLEKRKEVLSTVDVFGVSTMKQSSDKNRMLQITVGNLSKSGDEGGVVAKGLGELQLQLKDLDPSVIDFMKKGFLGKLFNPLRAYFQKFERADAVINNIIKMLNDGKQTLKDDNTTLLIEQQALRDLTKRLQKEIQLVNFMDESIETQVAVAKSRNEDAEKIRFITEEVLFPLRQRAMDMQAMMAVNQQGYISFEVVIRNNNELIRGVDRANTVTISALRVAVTVASALYNQKIVLERINALNATTNQFISNTSKMLNEQGVAIQKQAIEASISVDTLKQAFADSFAALESISTYKQQALPKMRDTIAQFRQLAEEGEKHIVRLEKGNTVGI